MDKRAGRIAALANQAAYDERGANDYVDGAPHVKHDSVRRLYESLLVEVFERARRSCDKPHVLDLGAGQGFVTIPMLELGARVTAVDLSPHQLAALRRLCGPHSEELEIRCGDVNDVLDATTERYDIVVVGAFLHHIPDYLALLRRVMTVLAPHGQFLSFQDPLRYDTVGRASMLFTNLSYFSWRLFKGDLAGGLVRRIRRSLGIYLESSEHDNAEYHVTRNGVDHESIEQLFTRGGFACRVVSYFSTQSEHFQTLGDRLGLRNTFAVVAHR